MRENFAGQIDEMAFSRHNIEKRRLIDLVRLNPILWDCRLPHYKRSDKKKAIKWNELGRVFGVSGERVQRTFTSLREIFRRELNHEKMLGTRFKSKWEYYDAMAFLKEVIRERKSRERAKVADLQQHHNNGSIIDEYQYFAPNDPNNPNNQAQQQQQLQQQQLLAQTLQQASAMPRQPPSAAAPPLPDMVQQHQQQQQQQHQQPQQHLLQLPSPIQLQPDVILSLNASAISTMHKLSNNGQINNGNRHQSSPQQQHQQSQQPLQLPQPSQSPQAISSSHSCSSSPSIYIKDEPDSQDDTISLATTVMNDKLSGSSKVQSATKNAKQRNENTKNYNNNNIIQPMRASFDATPKRKLRRLHSAGNLVIDEDVTELEAHADAGNAFDVDDDPDVELLDDGRLSPASTYMLTKPHRPTAREILYTKFGDFLAARLNTLSETEANDLMNGILLLIAEK